MKTFPPNMVIIIIVLILVGASVAILLNRQNSPVTVPNSNSEIDTPESSKQPTLAASTQYLASDSSDIDYIDTYNSEVSQSPLPSPASLSQYIYPGSDVLSNSSLKIEMQSNQEYNKISDWYKEKIRELNFNAKSFTQTNTNGVIFIKLSAAKPGEKIEVTIKKDQNASIVIITVDRP